MAHRIVEIVIGRLITDEQFRADFVADASAALAVLCDRGLPLNAIEIAALTNTDPSLWAEVADAVDPRLLKVSRDAASEEGVARVEPGECS